jgi:hypothetical protein
MLHRGIIAVGSENQEIHIHIFGYKFAKLPKEDYLASSCLPDCYSVHMEQLSFL